MQSNDKVDPYFTFRDHSTGTNNNTEVVVLEAIRSAHPDLHITPVLERECDLIGWAKDGHASVTLQRQEFVVDIVHPRVGFKAKPEVLVSM